MAEDTLQPRVKISWFIGIAAGFALFALIAAYSARQARDVPSYDDQLGAQRMATLAKLQADNHKTLTTADWVDQDKGTVRIPIAEAMPEELITLQGKPVQAGAAIPGATPTAPNVIPATAANQAPAGTANAPSTNAAPTAPPPPSK